MLHTTNLSSFVLFLCALYRTDPMMLYNVLEDMFLWVWRVSLLKQNLVINSNYDLDVPITNSPFPSQSLHLYWSGNIAEVPDDKKSCYQLSSGPGRKAAPSGFHQFNCLDKVLPFRTTSLWSNVDRAKFTARLKKKKRLIFLLHNRLLLFNCSLIP